MGKYLLTLLVMLSTTSALACTPSDNLPCGAGDDADMFKAMDDDYDGYVSRKEFMMHSREVGKEVIFKCADTNIDGKLDMEEFKRSAECADGVHAPANYKQFNDNINKEIMDNLKETGTSDIHLVPGQ